MFNFFNTSYITSFYILSAIILFLLILQVKKNGITRITVFLFIFGIIFDLTLFQLAMYKAVTLPREGITFNEYPTPYKFPKKRILNLISDDAFNNFRPTLYKKHVALNSYTLTKSFFKKSKIESVYVKLNIYGVDIAFFNELNNLNIKQFIIYGFENIDKWSLNDRLLFLEILQAINEGFAARSDFYIEHTDIGRITYGLVETLGQDSYAFLVIGPDSKERIKVRDSFMAIFDMAEEKFYGYKDNESVTLTEKQNSDKAQAFYRFLYNDISAKEYLTFSFEDRVRPGQIFVLLSDYYRLIEPREAYREFIQHSAFLSDKIEAIIGVSGPIIQYYPDASYMPQEKIIKDIRGNSDFSRNRLYLADSNKFIGQNGRSENKFSYKIIKYNPNMLSLSYDSSRNGYLYYSDCYDTYWNAYIDSKKTNVYKANGAFKAIKIPAGAHKVKFSYNPIYFRVSLWFYYIVFSLCFSYLIIGAFIINRKS
ncbi:MAG: YfhO family protein [Candidatus Omnitrophota bacterium]|jgi:hypothetical protein